MSPSATGSPLLSTGRPVLSHRGLATNPFHLRTQGFLAERAPAGLVLSGQAWPSIKAASKTKITNVLGKTKKLRCLEGKKKKVVPCLALGSVLKVKNRILFCF